MGKINGKDAFILLIEDAEGFQKLSEEEVNKYTAEFKRFFSYLVRKHGTVEAAQEICDHIKKSTLRELRTDWQDVFRISEKRLENEFAMEIDIMAAQISDKPAIFERECLEDISYWDHLQKIAWMNAERPQWDRWKRALENLEEFDEKLTLMECIFEYQGGFEAGELKKLQELFKELNELRFGRQVKGKSIAFPHSNPELRARGCLEFKTPRIFLSRNGDGIYISWNMWAERRNRLNALTGDERRYVRKEKSVSVDRKTLEDSWCDKLDQEVPADDDAWFELTVYGLDVDMVGRS